MPKLKKAVELDIPKDIFLIMEYYMGRQGVSVDDVAVAMGISRTTYYKRKANPSSLTFKEAALAARKLKVPLRLLLFGTVTEKIVAI